MSEIQNQINLWFDQIYQKRGFRYLRPPEAYRIFISVLAPEHNGQYLDVGCGLGLLVKLMSDRGFPATGVDISSEAIKIAKSYCPEAQFILANSENLPFENKSFDYITCIGSFERMINREKAIREQVRVASDSARFCYMVRNANHFSWRYFKKPLRLANKKGHQDALPYQKWVQLFESCGLKIISVFPDHWPYYKFRKSIPFWNRNINYSQIRKFRIHQKNPYEFIFLLKKNE